MNIQPSANAATFRSQGAVADPADVPRWASGTEIVEAESDENFVHCGDEIFSVVPQLGFSRQRSATFEQEMTENLPRVLRALLH